VLRIAARKAEELESMCAETERELLMLTIRVGKRAVRVDEPGLFDTWFVVQVVRDALAKELHALDRDEARTLKRGTLYRRIREGGDVYMPLGEMARLVKEVMPSAVQGLEEDLGLLKEHAKEIVKGVAENRLVGAVGDVGYVTCVKIRREDVVWEVGTEV
jgi:hypothetical protein